MRKFRYIAVLLSVVISTTGAQARKWDLRKCVDYAVDNNIQVKQAEVNARSREFDNQQAKYDYLPTLGASAGYSASFGRSLDQTTYQFSDKSVQNINGSVALNTQVFGGFAKKYNLEKSKFDLFASLADVEKLKNDISLNVAAAYLQILFNKEQIAVSEGQVEVLKKELERTTKLVEAGSAAMTAKLELEAQLAAEEYNLVTYRNNHSTSILVLVQLMELRDADGFDIVVPVVESIVAAPITESIDDTYDRALGLPQITGAEHRLGAAGASVGLAKSRYWPTLNFSVSYGSSYSDSRQMPIIQPNGTIRYEDYAFADQIKDNASTLVSLSMQIPIFNGLTARRNVSKAKLGVENSEYALQQEKNRLYKDIQQAHNDATGAYNRYNSAEISVRNSEESFRNTRQRFEVGAANSVDYITAQNNLLRAKSQMLQSKYDYIFKVKILDFYMGRPLVL